MSNTDERLIAMPTSALKDILPSFTIAKSGRSKSKGLAQRAADRRQAFLEAQARARRDYALAMQSATKKAFDDMIPDLIESHRRGEISDKEFEGLMALVLSKRIEADISAEMEETLDINRLYKLVS